MRGGPMIRMRKHGARYAAAAALGIVALGGARRLLSTVNVRGGSMNPTLLHDDVLLVLKHVRRCRPGRIVVVQRPDSHAGWSGPLGQRESDGYFVKRVVAVAGEPVPPWVPEAQRVVPPRMLVLRGDHSDSQDSRMWGFCPQDRMYGVMLFRLPGRR
ncbi:S26 family signal peptidase [Streptomyces sp. NPDC048248]|uniref:S26 family signal peptidase n=1 Tax=Streptomyces sp. NPDC048248 TaxID=3365523 RepID=UPI00372090FF